MDHFDSYRQSETPSITREENEDKEFLGEDEAENQLTSQQESAYNDVYAAVRGAFRAGLDLKDVQHAINAALPWKLR